MAQICPECKTSNADTAATCHNCGTALPGAPAPPAAVGAATATPAGATTFRPAGVAGRRAAPSSGAIAEAARRAAAQRRAAEEATRAAQAPAPRPAPGAPRPAAGSRVPLRSPTRNLTAPINNALDRAGLPRFSTQRYLIIWLGFAVAIVAVILALVWFGASQARQTAVIAPTAQPGNVLTSTTVIMTTTKGTFTIQLAGDDPTMRKTVKNFRDKVASGYFNGTIFHRVENWIVQGGAAGCSATDTRGCTAPGDIMSAEYNDKPFKRGTVGMAGQGQRPLTVSADQWFIAKTDAPSLTNNDPNFATVTAGLSVVDQLIGCAPKAGGNAGDLDCSKADKVLTATLGLK